MSQRARASGRAAATPPPRRRLTADARRNLILKAARRAFTETGDMSGTTIRVIAEKAGISEGLIYRHFESKEQLYIEAVVVPLREVVDKLVAAAEVVDRDQPPTRERRLSTLQEFYGELVATLEDVLPLLGLVLFGDPKVARRFYRNDFAAAMDRLADAWRSVEGRYGFEAQAPDISVRAVTGMALMVALESHHNNRFNRDRAIAVIAEGTTNGFVPRIDGRTRRR
jgi:AcrR family transcriptional regulator